MLLHEMIKELHENKKDKKYFIKDDNKDSIIICYLRSQAGSIEFRLFDGYTTDYLSHDPILYTGDDKWRESSFEEINIYMKKKSYDGVY